MREPYGSLILIRKRMDSGLPCLTTRPLTKDTSSSEAVILILCVSLSIPPQIYSLPVSDLLCALGKLLIISTNSITGILFLAGFYVFLNSSYDQEEIEGGEWKRGKDRREVKERSLCLCALP